VTLARSTLKRTGWSIADGLFGAGVHVASIRAITALLVVGASIAIPHFFEFGNLQAIMYSIAAVGIGAIGMALVTISGNLFMLSMGATAAVSTVMFASWIHFGLWVAIALVGSAGIGIGLAQGVLIGVARTNPIITTIAMSSVIIGVGVIATDSATIVGQGDASWLGFGHLVPGVPNQILVMAIFALIAAFALERTRVGREIRLMGMHREVARVAGLRLLAATLVAYAFAGLAASLAGALISSAAAQGNLTQGIDLDFNAIAAVLVGGISIQGGRGHIQDAVIGAIFIGVVSNVLLVSGVNYETQLVIKGLVVLLSVVLGPLTARLSPRRAGD
jgi:ribose transport system permease protein